MKFQIIVNIATSLDPDKQHFMNVLCKQNNQDFPFRL